MQKLLFPFVLLLWLVSACTKPNEEPTATAPLGDGYGKSTQSFSGPRWQLPAGVSLADSNRVHDFSYCFYFRNPPVSEQVRNFRGTPGGAFTVCFTLRNTGNQPVTVVPPPALLIQNDDVDTQNGLIINLNTILLPANSELTVFANAFCLNLDRDIPGSDPERRQTFQFGPAQLPAGLQEVVDIVAAKNITGNDLVDPATGNIDGNKFVKMSVVQEAIWKLTETGKLPEDLKSRLKALSL